MKRIIFVLSALILLFCLTFSAFAADQSTVDPDELIEFDEPYYIESTEDKLICSATLDDDFVPNEVIVLMSTEVSLQFKDYTVDDFSELDVESVDYVLPYGTQKTREKFERYIEEIEEYYEMENIYADETERHAYAVQTAIQRMKNQNYHTRLLLTLRESDKSAVLEAIKALEKRDDVYAAVPDYISNVVPCGIIGDADKDGDLTILDATHIQLYKAELIDESKIDLAVADYDEDGDVTILDATAIQRTIEGLTTEG